MIKKEIVNVIATASVNQQLDFEELGKLEEIFHDSDVYGGRVAYFKTSDMEGRVSLFHSGKMISAGTRSEKKASEELASTMQFLVEKGFVRMVTLSPQVRNIVVKVDFETSINIEELATRTSCIYEPEQFAAVILRADEPKACILIFSSGKTIITGLKSSQQIDLTVQKLKGIIFPQRHLTG
jgi:transcription initiation factor TFIID TATA-box-binding protein